jgi:hypothetical protein
MTPLASRGAVALALISFAWLGLYFFGMNQSESFNPWFVLTAWLWWVPLLSVAGLITSFITLLRKPDPTSIRWARWGLWLNLSFIATTVLLMFW